MDNNMAANASAESVDAAFADFSNNVDSSVGEGSVAASGNAPAAGTQPAQDVTQTKAFSRRLNEMSAQRTDAAIKGLGMTNHYTNSPIETIADLQAYNAMRQADEQGGDPQSAADMINLQAQLNQQNAQLAEYRLREQEAAIAADPVMSALYDEYRDEVAVFMEIAASNGNEFELGTALNVVLSEHLGDIRAREYERGKAEALASINANRAASPGSVGGAPAGGAMSYADMSSEEFNKYYEMALSGELRKS